MPEWLLILLVVVVPLAVLVAVLVVLAYVEQWIRQIAEAEVRRQLALTALPPTTGGEGA